MLDAIMEGKPVIFFKVGETYKYIPENCGIGIDVISYDQVVNELGNAILKALHSIYLTNNNNEPLKFHCDLPKTLFWEEKIKRILQIYLSVVKSSSS